jgi:predicted polyphosphate/ATP-dependent NAD kinase
MGTIGILANPASGKDIRRLVAPASVFDNQEKQAIIKRALAGIVSSYRGREPRELKIAYLNDGHGIVRTALEEVLSCRDRARMTSVVAETNYASAQDTCLAASALHGIPASVVITLGGDGTNRAFTLGWRNPTLIAISTGTNNVFPVLTEATIAGAAAGLIASGAVRSEEVTSQQKIIEVDIEGEQGDLALIDAVLVRDRFVGARALLSPENFVTAVLTMSDPAAIGITAIGGLIHPIAREKDFGLHIEFGPGLTVTAPIAPGHYQQVSVLTHRELPLSDAVHLTGPGVLAFDGERERVIKPGQKVTCSITRTGPHLVDIPATLKLAAERGCCVADNRS